MASKPLVFIPTYNERETSKLLCEELLKLKADFDILFLDDNSPDGTGDILDASCCRTPASKGDPP